MAGKMHDRLFSLPVNNLGRRRCHSTANVFTTKFAHPFGKYDFELHEEYYTMS